MSGLPFVLALLALVCAALAFLLTEAKEVRAVAVGVSLLALLHLLT